MPNMRTPGMAEQVNRLSGGGSIDRSRTLNFSFDGKSYSGYQGDTLASALLANGEKIFGRSFKYHRPRGALSVGSDEPNALVELHDGDRREPNTCATTIELFDGLTAASQNRWPSLAFDVMSVNGLFSPVFVAGFYYKTFMWPKKGWLFYEHLIRHAAGLGTAATQPDPDHYQKMHGFCDVLVIGAGPSGLAAAIAAGSQGQRVYLIDENPLLGGSLRYDASDAAKSLLAEQLAAVNTMPNVHVLNRTYAFGAYDHGLYGLIERVTDHITPGTTPNLPRQRFWKIRADLAIYATGSLERPIVFGNNDKPGVMLSSAIRAYANEYAVLPGRDVVLFTNNDSAYTTALELNSLGASVSIVDSRPSSNVSNTAASNGIVCHTNSVVADANGFQAVSSVTVTDTRHGSSAKIKCDLLGMSGGWTPVLHLQCHKSARPVYDDSLVTLVPRDDFDGYARTVGSANAIWDLDSCVESGKLAVNGQSSMSLRANSTACEPLWQVKQSKHKAFVDFQNDVTNKDIELAEREGYKSVEHLKRYTTLGMATDQGKSANLNGLALLAQAKGETIQTTGTTTYRPPYLPVALGAITGQSKAMHVSPKRLTPMHGWHIENGAKMLTVGQWMRPWFYPENADDVLGDAYIREAGHVREETGIIDVTTLGKIAVQGPDAAGFLHRLYSNGFEKLPVNKSRYGIMLREDGLPFDDGTVGRLAEDDFVITTTTANAAIVMVHMEKHAHVIWPALRVHLTSITEQWGTIALAGRNSRRILEKVVDGDAANLVSNQALPFMGILQTTLNGVEARIFRISFSGELAYEINVPSHHGEAVWRTLMQAGEEFKLKPYGTEAMGALRIEKGHIIAAELDGRNSLNDLGFAKMASTKKDYIGRYYAQREAFHNLERPQFVGFIAKDPQQSLQIGAQITEFENFTTPCNTIGHVTSTTYSPALGHYIALGLVTNGRSRHGDTVYAQFALKNKKTAVTIVEPVFYDQAGALLHG